MAAVAAAYQGRFGLHPELAAPIVLASAPGLAKK
jgi:hypothetical protein